MPAPRRRIAGRAAAGPAIGIQTFAEVGNALLAIREAKLYRAEHGTFEAYCLKRWGFSRPRAYQLIEAAAVVSTIVDKGSKPPSTESQARPLTKLPAAEQPAAWQAATEKRRCVMIAVAEFPDLSSRAIAEMCGVNHEMVSNARPQLADSANTTRTGTDGKQYKATKRQQIKTPAQEEAFYEKRAKEAPDRRLDRG